jgi:hypothetical protein
VATGVHECACWERECTHSHRTASTPVARHGGPGSETIRPVIQVSRILVTKLENASPAGGSWFLRQRKDLGGDKVRWLLLGAVPTNNHMSWPLKST